MDRKKTTKAFDITGARQTGKSTLIWMFASKKGLLLNEINLEQHLYLDDVFKILDINNIIFMDIGIVNHICGNDWGGIQLFLESELINEGGLAEQFIGQHFLALKNEAPILCYWLRENKSANAEVDYVISQANKVLPVEVKSGKSGTLKSLQQFLLKKTTEPIRLKNGLLKSINNWKLRFAHQVLLFGIS